MSNLDTLFDKLQKGQRPKVAEEQWAPRKQEWIQDLEKLRDDVSGWLQKGVDGGLMKLERRTVELDEQGIGTYVAPALSIYLDASGPRVIKIEPKGLGVPASIPTDRGAIAAIGRVDLSCGAARAMLLRAPGRKWMFVARDRSFNLGGQVLDLDPDSLGEVIGELLE